MPDYLCTVTALHWYFCISFAYACFFTFCCRFHSTNEDEYNTIHISLKLLTN